MYLVKVNDQVVASCNAIYIRCFARTRRAIDEVNALCADRITKAFMRGVMAIVAQHLDVVGVERNVHIVDIVERQFHFVVRAQFGYIEHAAAFSAYPSALYLASLRQVQVIFAAIKRVYRVERHYIPSVLSGGNLPCSASSNAFVRNATICGSRAKSSVKRLISKNCIIPASGFAKRT